MYHKLANLVTLDEFYYINNSNIDAQSLKNVVDIYLDCQHFLFLFKL